MPSNESRREYLLTLASTAAAVGLAGCADESGTGTPTANATADGTPTTTPLPPAPAPDFGGHLEDVGNYDGTVTDLRGRDIVTVEVGVTGNGGAFAFGPPAVHVDTGTRVLFKWTGEAGGHTVVSSDDGPLDSGDPVAELGVNYEYTFETDGIYPYHCAPHRSLGMRGAVVVGTDYPTADSA